MNRFRLATTLALALLAPLPLLATPVSSNGEIKVRGNRIVNQAGTPIQLVGMSMYWSIWGGEKYYNPDVVAWLAKDWRSSVVRAAIAIEPTGGYLTNPDVQIARARTIIDAAIANGIYVIVDYHAHDANQHIPQAKTFFETLSRAYGNTPNLIWEIWNEPNSRGGTGAGGADSWADIKAYANEIIPVIRKHSKNIIVVGTPTWSQGVDAAAASPLADPNTAYTLHFYARSHKQWLRDRADAALAKGIALFITEWGTSHADGGSATNRGIDTVESAIWWKWAADRKIGMANWSLVNFTESSAALAGGASTKGGWSTNDLSASGAWVRRQIQAANPTTTSVSQAQRPSSRFVVRGRTLSFGSALTAPSELVVRAMDGRELLRRQVEGTSTDLPRDLAGIFVVELATPSERIRETVLVP